MNDEHRDEAILQSLFAHKLKLSVKAIREAKDAAWRDLPANERKTYLKLAEKAVQAEMKGRPS